MAYENHQTVLYNELHLHLNYSPSEILKVGFLKWLVFMILLSQRAFWLNLRGSLLMSVESFNIPNVTK